MGLEKDSTTKLKIPKCVTPREFWEKHILSDMNLCVYPNAKDCPYRVEVLTLHVCEYSEEEKSER